MIIAITVVLEKYVSKLELAVITVFFSARSVVESCPLPFLITAYTHTSSVVCVKFRFISFNQTSIVYSITPLQSSNAYGIQFSCFC